VTSRRQFLETSALFAATAALERVPVSVVSRAPRGFIDLRRAPDSVMVQTADGDRRLARDAGDRWTDRDIVVVTTPGRLLLHVGLTSPTVGAAN
jgi:hypothetical protein